MHRNDQSTLSDNLNRAKLYRPPTPMDYVPRSRLLEQLKLHPEKSLVLVSASAGFGKTTLLSDWLAQSALPNAWLALDENDNDLVTFLSYFIAAVQTIFPNAVRMTQALLNAPTLPPLVVLANSLINELDELDESFIFVLDDYYVIQSLAIHDLLTELITYCPRPLHLVIATRFDPPLPLGRLRARNQMIELRTEDLRFSLPESHALIYAVLGIDTTDQVVDTLSERVEGWVAGLRLLMASLRVRGRTRDAEGIVPVRDRFLIDYLANEVLVNLPAATQRFVLEISILERFNASLCKSVTGLDSLQSLQDNELFVVPVDETRDWFRFHKLFQEFLSARLTANESADQIALLHRRASQWFNAHNLIEDALHHALAANDFQLAAEFVEEHRHALLDETHLPRLDRWLRLIPPDVIEERPALLLSLAWVAWFRAKMSELIALVNRAENLVQAMSPDSAKKQVLEGEVATFRSYQYYWTGEYALAHTQAQLALDKTTLEFLHVRAMARLFLAASWQVQGNLNQALQVVEEGVSEARSHRLSLLRNLLTALFVHWVNADLLHVREIALSMRELIKGHDYPQMLLWVNYFLGTMYYQRNEMPEAERYLSTLVEQRHLAHLNALTNGAFALALVYQAENQPERARETLETLRSFLAESGNVPLLSLVQAYQAELAMRQEDAGETPQLNPGRSSNALAPTPNFYTPSLTYPKALVRQNIAESRQTAQELLMRLEQYNESTHNNYALIKTLALEALLYQAKGERETALRALERALRLGVSHGIIRVFADLGPAMGDLLKQLYHRQVERPYIEQILAALSPKFTAPVVNQSVLAESLTDRETKILLLLSKGLSNKEIAARETLTIGTVKQYIFHLYQKLLVTNRREALAKARGLGLLPTDQENH